MGKSHSFLAQFTEARPLVFDPPRNSEFIDELSQQKWLPPYRDLFSLYLYHVVHINVDLKWSYTLDYIATSFRSPIYALHRLAVRAIQCKVVLFLFELFC